MGFAHHGWHHEPYSPVKNSMCKRWDTLHITAIEFGGFSLRVLKDSQRYGTLRYRQLDPVSDAQCCGAGHELLPSPLWLGARMVCQVLIGLGHQRLERG